MKPISKTPYYNTTVSERKSEIDISNLLEKYDITHYRWTTMGNEKTLELAYPQKNNQQCLLIKIPVPPIKALSRGQVVVIPMKQRLRMVYTFLKSLLEASEFGLFSIEEVFFGFLQYHLPDGTQISTKELIDSHKGSLLLSEPEA